MRRPAAALAATVLAAVILGGPMASPGVATPSSAVQCAAVTPSSACPFLDQLAAQLAPVQPVLALAGPVTAELASAVAGLAARADEPAGVPSAEAAGQAQALLDQLSMLPAPVRDLLAVTQLDGIVGTLEAFVSELAAPVTGDPSAAETGSPTPSATGGSSTGAAGSSAPGSFGGSVSATGDGGATPATSSPAIPDVPVGDSLTFAPLALPDFGFSPTIGLDPQIASEAVIEDVQRAINATALDLADPGNGAHPGVVVVVSLLLLGAAWAAQAQQARQAHRTIPD
jgi:hypothetical protein